jgi:hypothetical protein
MSNANTIQGSNKTPSAALGNATSETQFTDSDGNVLTAYIPLTRKLVEGSAGTLKVKVGGRVTGGTTTNWTPKVYWGNDSTIANNSEIAALTAFSVVSTSTNWHAEVTLIWDATSSKVNGWFQGQNGTTTVSPTTITNAQTSKDLTASDSTSVGFSVTGLFGSTNASNTAYVDYFDVESY